MERWAYYARKGNEHSINSASFLIPWDVPGPVVLDATAHSNFLWDLFEGRSQTVPTPSKVRDYSTVTLHIARVSGLGKHSMVKNIQARFPRLLQALETELSPERSCVSLACTRMRNMFLNPTHRNDKFSRRFSVGHWGAVDGSNVWETYDTAVIFGFSRTETAAGPLVSSSRCRGTKTISGSRTLYGENIKTCGGSWSSGSSPCR